MTREEFIKILDNKVRIIRLENDFTQDKMAEIIGLSKKTLVQIEKGRSSLGWTGAVTVCSIFFESEILQMSLGGDSHELILTLSFKEYEAEGGKTMGGKIWWKEIEEKNGICIQRNIISNHYRILDAEERRISSSFDVAYIKKRYAEITNS